MILFLLISERSAIVFRIKGFSVSSYCMSLTGKHNVDQRILERSQLRCRSKRVEIRSILFQENDRQRRCNSTAIGFKFLGVMVRKMIGYVKSGKVPYLDFWQISQHNAHTEMHSSKWRVRKLCWAKRSWIYCRIWLEIRWLFIFKDQKRKYRVGLIPRLFSYFDSFLFKKLFSTYVRPHIHNDHVIWAPCLKKSVK